MISTNEKDHLLTAFARAEMNQNSDPKWSQYQEALESAKNLSERAETDLERRWISNVRLANCRSLMKFLATAGTQVSPRDGDDLGVLLELRPELHELIEQDATVRDQIERFFEKHPLFPRNWATAITNNIVLSGGNPTMN